MVQTITRRQVIAAAFQGKFQNRIEKLRFWWVRPYPDSDKELYEWCWNELINWYLEEAKVIGRERAFWGLVYRLLDVPTKEDVEWIRSQIRRRSLRVVS